MKLRLLRTSTIALAAVFAWTVPALAVGPLALFAWSPSPIATSASLPASPNTGSSVTVTVTAEDSTGTAIPGATVYLSLSNVKNTSSQIIGGTAVVGQTIVDSHPRPFLADGNGKVAVLYTTPTALPTGGKDILKAANAASGGSITSKTEYCFGQVVRYVTRPTGPIAPPASLTANQVTQVSVTAVNAAGQAVANVPVFIRFSQQTGGGSAAVSTTAISNAFAPFNTSANGSIIINYTASNVTTGTGIDEITMADAAVNPCVSKKDKYSYAGPTHYQMQLTPIAVPGGLPANFSVLVQVTALDANSTPVIGAQVFLSFNNQSGGSALVGRTLLTSTPRAFATNSTGRISITYITPLFLPAPATVDTIIAGNLATSPTVTAQDTYTY